MKVAIYTQKQDIETSHYLDEFIHILTTQYHVECLIHQDSFSKLKLSYQLKTFKDKINLKENKIDLLFSFGGDGTILNTLTFIEDLEIPIVGVNMGRLGFLACFSKEELFSKLDDILSNQFEISTRNILKIKTKNATIDFPYALNDVCITRKETTSMITIDSYIDNDFLTVFWGDGLVISTPTGSTAYNLSCGGPILSPNSNNLALTPIAPHNLNLRPLILSDDTEIRLIVKSRVPSFSLSLDSRLYELKLDDEIKIHKANFKLHLVVDKNINFFETLRRKLLWGQDKRN